MPHDVDGGRKTDLSPVLTIFSASVLSFVLQWTNGMYRSPAVLVVALAWAVLLAAVFVKRTARDVRVPLLLGVLALSFGLMLTEPPSSELVRRPESAMRAFAFCVALGAFAVGLPMRHRTPWFVCLVGLHFVMGMLVLRVAPHPAIDVWSIEMEAVPALLRGENPYAMTFLDPYNGQSPFFPPGTSVGGRLQFGFVYPPLSLLLCVPGYLLGGDTRWSTLVAMELAALLIGFCRPGRVPKLAALAFLFMPRTFFVMDRAWTDPFVVLLTAAVCFTALRRPRWAFLPIGLYVCLKQHMFIGVPALFLLVPRPIPWGRTLRMALLVAVVAGLVTLPLALWSWHSFAKSVLDIREMFRVDSLGLIAFLHNHGVATLSKWAGLAAIVPVAVLGAWRAPRTPGGFALLAGATHMTLYIWSTHAFCNEYYNVFGAVMCAVAAWGPWKGGVLET